jgi:predicted CXXCH cytochrome family protein
MWMAGLSFVRHSASMMAFQPRSSAGGALGVVVLALGATALTLWALTPDYAGVRAGHSDVGYLESRDCRKCHESRYASWRATFHRSMTQEARPETVLGDFDHDNTLTYQGIRAEMLHVGASYRMRLSGEGKDQELEIGRTVGSRRIQQYLSRDGDKWLRLPVAYDLVQRRWMHLNGSFFGPDGRAYTQHVTEWNSNCVFCHNVKAQPGYDWSKKAWNTEVAELGIACGACHGPAGEHAQRALSPLTRYRWQFGDRSAPGLAVINPAKLDSDRAAMICGHCHGQRVPDPTDRIRSILTNGDPYDAGADLRQFYEPVERDTKVGHFSFATRFWADGSPRLTAYEYQGLMRSKCFRAGQPGARITCTSCHSMHAGDPRGQLTERNQTNAACTQCHQAYAQAARLAEHTKHAPGSAGTLCYDCHMPQIVYGVMARHRTHDISIPEPAETVRFDKPNACSLCHAEWSVNRARAEKQRLWPGALTTTTVVSGARFDEPEGARALFAGDAVTRALSAAAMTPATQATAPWLLQAMQDPYPVVRYFAANALAAQHPELPKPDYLAPADTRAKTLLSWYPRWTPDALKAAQEARARLSTGHAEVDVEVGE